MDLGFIWLATAIPHQHKRQHARAVIRCAKLARVLCLPIAHRATQGSSLMPIWALAQAAVQVLFILLMALAFLAVRAVEHHALALKMITVSRALLDWRFPTILALPNVLKQLTTHLDSVCLVQHALKTFSS